MDVEIRNRPAFTNLLVKLNAGEKIVVEASAMASMSSSIDMTTKLNGGFFGGVARKYLGSESMFVNEFSTMTSGELVLTQSYPGDMMCLDLKGTSMYLQPGAFIACEPGVQLSLGWAGFSSFVGGEGLFRLKVSGFGRCWFGSYGGIFEREITGEYVVDSGHLVAYEPSIQLSVGMSGGIFSTMFGGEGLVTRIKGPGKIYMQSRSFDGLAAWTNTHLW